MPSRLEDITEQRLERLDEIRSQGINPYPHTYHPSHSIKAAIALYQQDREEASSPISLAGRIVAKRSMGKISFMDIQGEEEKIQLCFRRDNLGQERYNLLKKFDIGDFIGVEGTLFQTKTGELTLEVSDFTMLSKSLHPLPEKWHGLADIEVRYRQRYLDLICNKEVKRIFILRSKIINAIRSFLNNRGFIEVETPVFQLQAGGALARPFTTHHHALDEILYLRIALELYLKRLIIGGFDRVYEIGRTFRNEGISIKHNPEFTLLECYQSYSDYFDMMEMVEEMFFYIAREVLSSSRITYGDRTIDLTPPWQRITLREAIKSHCGIDFEDYPDASSLRSRMIAEGMQVDSSRGRGKLIDDLTSTFVEPFLTEPTFLVDYPVEISPLAKRKRDNDRLVERFEGFIAGIEIANAFTELNDPIDQRERFVQQARERLGDEEVEVADEDFLQAMEYGMPPTGGLGIGIDRAVMLLTNQQSIRDVILFPQLKRKDA